MRGMFKMAESGWRVLRMDLPRGLQMMLDDGHAVRGGNQKKVLGLGHKGLDETGRRVEARI